jgi:DNA-binding MarR family transcriptional regulator
MSTTATHLWAFSALLAADPAMGKLNPRHLQLLALVCDNGVPLARGDAAAVLEISAPTISRTADRLIEIGLLTRTDSADDRRVSEISATALGRAVNERVRSYFEYAKPIAA